MTPGDRREETDLRAASSGYIIYPLATGPLQHEPAEEVGHSASPKRDPRSTPEHPPGPGSGHLCAIRTLQPAASPQLAAGVCRKLQTQPQPPGPIAIGGPE